MLLAGLIRNFKELWGIVKHSLPSKIDRPLWRYFATVDVHLGMYLQDRWDDAFGLEGNPYRPIWYPPPMASVHPEGCLCRDCLERRSQ